MTQLTRGNVRSRDGGRTRALRVMNQIDSMAGECYIRSMTIYLGTDHGGFELKEAFKNYLKSKYPALLVEDCGAFTYEQDDDYPQIAFEVAEKVVAQNDPGAHSLGILFCRSGSGMVIAANKVKGIRAVEIYDQKIAAHAKSHNRANVIAFSGDYLSLVELQTLFEIFSQTEVDSSERHERRIAEIMSYENNR